MPMCGGWGDTRIRSASARLARRSVRSERVLRVNLRGACTNGFQLGGHWSSTALLRRRLPRSRERHGAHPRRDAHRHGRRGALQLYLFCLGHEHAHDRRPALRGTDGWATDVSTGRRAGDGSTRLPCLKHASRLVKEIPASTFLRGAIYMGILIPMPRKSVEKQPRERGARRAEVDPAVPAYVPPWGTCRFCKESAPHADMVRYGVRHPVCLFQHRGIGAIDALHIWQLRHLPIVAMMGAGVTLRQVRAWQDRIAVEDAALTAREASSADGSAS